MAGDLPFPLVPTIVLAGLSVCTLYTFIIYPIFLHPLRHIPSAHWSIPLFGDCWILYQRLWSRNNAVTYAAHQRHGEVVRLGRNELSVNCVDNGIKTIYGGGWEKHAWYPQLFASYGAINMFSTVHHTPHSQKKRTMANVYSKSYLASSTQLAANSKTLLSTRFLPLLQSLSGDATPVDVHELNNALTMDFMSAYQFGLAHSTNFAQDVQTRRSILHDYHSRRPYEFYSSETPWLKPLCRKLGLSIVPKSMDTANEVLQEWNKGMCRAADSYLVQHSGSSDSSPGDEPVVYKHFKNGLTSLRAKDPTAARAVYDQFILPTSTNSHPDIKNLTTSEIYSEMLDQLGAGHETSAIALTYLYYELSKDAKLQQELREEIQTLNPRIIWPPQSDDAFELPHSKDIDPLPLLNSVLMETLRLHTPIPGMEPRVSPSTSSPTGHQLGSYKHIPAGVRVSSMPFCLHRNSTVFPKPHSFEAKRWLSTHTSADQLKEMHRWFWAFGSGGRMCIGSHLAIQEIKLLVCAIYGNWRTEIVDDEGIEEIDAYTTKPESNRLILRFVHV
jgi:Cytochrome P450